jgi:hypothetical protein
MYACELEVLRAYGLRRAAEGNVDVEEAVFLDGQADVMTAAEPGVFRYVLGLAHLDAPMFRQIKPGKMDELLPPVEYAPASCISLK